MNQKHKNMETHKIIKNILALAVVVMCLSSTSEVYGQSNKIKKANEYFSKYSYMEAIEIYEAVAEKGFKSEELFQRLGDSYYMNGKYEESVKWYGELFDQNPAQANIYNLRYSQSLKATGQKQLAKTYYDSFLSNIDQKSDDLISVDRYLEMIEQNSGRYTMNKLSLNSDGIDFGVGYKGNESIIFASSRDQGVLRDRRSSWDNQPYLDLYEAKIIAADSLDVPQKLKGKVNSKYHESTVAFSKSGTTMYFTRSNKKSADKKSPLKLKIYRSELENGKWTKGQDLTINSADFNTAHPALNSEEDKLYFTSDRPGGEGQTDLYYAPINEDGSLGIPVNLGKKVNTPGRESFPFVSQDNALYFSSDGHFGLGGYDVFYIKLDGQGYKGSLLNVGKPINSLYDDVAYVTKGGKGYISSNRSDVGESYDNIYGFEESSPIKDVYSSVLHGVVTDGKSNEPIADATIQILDVDNNLIQVLKTDSEGFYKTNVAYHMDYVVKATKDDYTGADAFSAKGESDRTHNFVLNSSKESLEANKDLAKILNIIIYFDFDKYNIRPDAEVELQKIVETLKRYPNIKIAIGSHTDSRANDAYNQVLSDKRAKSTMEYLIKEGISKQRLTAKGYGETQLLNNCSNGVSCSEKEHQKNRRSEFIIVE